MHYFQLRDDMEIPSRWSLEDPTCDEEIDSSAFTLGKKVECELPRITIYKDPGGETKPLNFSLTMLGVPVATKELLTAIEQVASSDVQRIPVVVGGRPGYEILNCLRIVDAVDERHSQLLKWSDKDGRPDKIGQYRMITTLRIDAARVPDDAHVFRLKGWKVALIVSETVKAAMERVGCFGAKFTQV